MCANCQLPVFIAERLNVGKLLYHRTCFRCARCDSQLSPANCYETENGFCCEVCPDEETAMSETTKEMVLQRALSDEEKTASLKTFSNNPDDYSAMFETALETLNSETGRFNDARSEFFQTQLDSSADSGTEEEPPELPNTAPPSLPYTAMPSDPSAKQDSGFPSVNSIVRLSVDVTKDKSLDESTNDTTSIVRARMRLFESNDIPPKSDLSRVSRKVVDTKTSVPIAKLEEINNFDADNKRNARESDEKSTETFEGKEEKSIEVFEEKQEKSTENFEGKEEDEIKFIDEAVNLPEDAVNISDKSTDSLTDDHKTANIAKEAAAALHKKPVVSYDTETVSNAEGDIVPLTNVPAIADNLAEEEPPLLSKEPNTLEIEVCKPAEEKELNESVVTVNSSIESPKVAEEESVILLQSSSEVIVIEDSPCSLKETKMLGEVAYPQEQNPFGDDSEDGSEGSSKACQDKIPDEEEYPEELNPFGEEDEDKQAGSPLRKSLKRISVDPNDAESPELNRSSRIQSMPPHTRKKIIVDTGTPIKPLLYTKRISYNPNENQSIDTGLWWMKPVPIGSSRKDITPPKSLNPFESDEEEEEQPRPAVRRKKLEVTSNKILEESRENLKVPVPTPRMSRAAAPVEADHKDSGGLSLSSRLNYGSDSSISSGSIRKKKPAPRPPILKARNEDAAPHSLSASPTPFTASSPKVTPSRKTRKAPAPPPSSTPLMATKARTLETPSLLGMDLSNVNVSPLSRLASSNKEATTDVEQVIEYTSPDSLPPPNKSTYGKWKRKKEQAPSLPIPVRRNIQCLPMAEIKRELELIEKQQEGLERQGVRLEQIIRDKCERDGEETVGNADDIPIEIEDLILQLFELVNEKNELFRKQSELMYLRKQQRLAEEHADVEYQIRCLMLLPETKKTDSDKAREEELIKRLVDIVERRNEIVESLDKDRLREAEEDFTINSHINIFTSKREEGDVQQNVSKKDKKKEEHKKKKKEKHDRKHKDKVDKGGDESETSTATLEKKKKFKLKIF